MAKNVDNWLLHYNELKAHILEHHRLPQKTVVEGRSKLHWWKYQQKKRKAGLLTEEQMELLGQLDCIDEPDQSTYSLPEDSPLSLVDMKNAIKKWSRGDEVNLKRSDVLCLYSPDLSDDRTQYIITRKDFKYNLLRKSFVWHK